MTIGSTPRLSIIIPVYNAMPYFGECLDSVLSQDIDPYQYELILVDDASTDGSGNLCRELDSLLPNVKAISLDENSGGCSRPRNVGLAEARGEFVFFADADDTFYPGALRKMLEHADELGCDIGLFKIDGRDWGGNYAGLFDKPQTHCTIDDSRILDFFGVYRLVKRSLLVDNDIRFIEGIVPEDWAFSLECYMRASNVCVINDQFYYRYRKRDDGQSLTAGNLTKLSGKHEAKIRAFREYLRIASQDAAIDDHPRIGLRLCRKMVEVYEQSEVLGFSHSELNDYQRLTREVAIDSVRAICPFSLLVKMDAMVQGLQYTAVSDALNGPHRFSFEKDEDLDATRYYLIDDTDCVVLSGIIPRDCKGELASPRYAICVVESIEWRGAILHIGGTAFMLRRAELSTMPYGSAAVYGTDFFYALDTQIVDVRTECAFGNVNAITFGWAMQIDFAKAPLHVDKRPTHIDPSINMKFDTGELLALRVGSRCNRAALDRYLACEVNAERFELVSELTGFGNFRLRVTPRSGK